jgi:hypothetical protein
MITLKVDLLLGGSGTYDNDLVRKAHVRTCPGEEAVLDGRDVGCQVDAVAFHDFAADSVDCNELHAVVDQ